VPDYSNSTLYPFILFLLIDNYKIFINFSFESQCSYTVMLDVVDNTFSINLEQRVNHTAIKIFAQDKEYTLMLSGKCYMFEVSVDIYQ